MDYDFEYYKTMDSGYKNPGSLASKKLEIIIKEINEGNSVLDIGCGTGEFLFRSADKFVSLVGIDSSPSALVWARRRLDGLKHISLLEGEIKQFNLKGGSFDCCLCLDVLEHVKNPSELVGELNRVLRSGAQLIISTPNWYDIIVSKVLKLNPLHLHAYTPFGWMRIIRRHGFKILLYRSIDFPLIKSELLAKNLPFLGLGVIIVAKKISDYSEKPDVNHGLGVK